MRGVLSCDWPPIESCHCPIYIYRIPSFNCLLLPRPLLGVRTGARPDERRIGDWGDTARDTEHRSLVLIKFDGTLHTSVSTEENGRPRDIGKQFT